MDRLSGILEASAAKFPGKAAIEAPGIRLSYEEFNRKSYEISRELSRAGARPGDRIGIYARKSIDTVAAIFGILKSGCAYVPVGVDSPPERNLFVFTDCSVQSIIIEKQYLPLLQNASPQFQFGALTELTGDLLLVPGPPKETREPSPSLAYLLYTSGSTGYPKGVMYPHKGALSFLQWCLETFPLSVNDRFSSHAPFHFDLSIFDLYVCFSVGGTLLLINEETGKNPLELARFISQEKISVWYSTPSVLSLLQQYGKLERYDYSPLRLVLFAGEVFPIKYLSALAATWKGQHFYNLYGPTETNVCTYYEISRPFPENRTTPFPIGKSCSHLSCKIFNENGSETANGERGELCVFGEIMSGYWNQPEKTENAFRTDSSGFRWYRTGDIVETDQDGNFVYVGRRDRMVKRRGYRVELGEIETMLYKHPAVSEAAVVSAEDSDGGIQIRAFLCVRDRAGASLIKMKQYASRVLPSYMVPDRFLFLPSLPKTSTDKIDYQQLLKL